MRQTRPFTKRQKTAVQKASKAVLTPDEQDEMAQAYGVTRQDLPLEMRGGLMGVFGYTGKQNG